MALNTVQEQHYLGTVKQDPAGQCLASDAPSSNPTPWCCTFSPLQHFTVHCRCCSIPPLLVLHPTDSFNPREALLNLCSSGTRSQIHTARAGILPVIPLVCNAAMQEAETKVLDRALLSLDLCVHLDIAMRQEPSACPPNSLPLFF
eukprot:140780-Pelagomonas_calceolata.AAC.4